MKISELIEKLEALKVEHGDIPVKCHTLTHAFSPDPEVRPLGAKVGHAEYVVLNP